MTLTDATRRLVTVGEADGPTARAALELALRKALPEAAAGTPLNELRLWHVTSRRTEDYIRAPDEATAVCLIAHLWDFEDDEQRLDETEPELVNR